MNKQKLMAQLQAKFNKVSAKCADLNADLNAKLQDDSSSVEDMKAVREQLSNEKVRRDALESQITDLQGEIDKEEAESNNLVNSEDKGKNLTPNSAKNKLENQKKAILNFMKRVPAKNQVSSTEMSPIIPETIIYNPSSEVNSVVDLSTLLTKTPVATKKGTYPIKKRADDYLPSTDELKENSELAKPDFTDIDWEVITHRGALTVSQESIDDAQPSTLDILGQDIGEKRVNTFNHEIAPILQSFTAKAVTINSDSSVDDIKHILNVDLDPAYLPVIIASQSFYDILDTLKDKNGQYIFHQDISSSSKGTLLGVPVYKVGDTLLGKAGDMKAFIGDIKRAVFFADRKEVNLSWEYDQVYGQYLAAVLRFGVTVADEKAGYFVTASTTASAGGQG
ncbi:phage phi-C31 gp36 major capsid family protein [Liquorilactobacillus aquaticus DSM 21051]|uniref:Phage phi-C31 gp36 major capsid family protein n=1 Tax=Liquorilactobacillus aquaticus DSM 21051 TaxID=1423725 RepID=A0A0R2CXI2_9LACO|nr:phage major capsid protein [Liquorilactobacillus aquaticus]KRM95962.1 phage phi-C31 gp36 major capsid family protein [Liquorilactobacillus aquaticus DSM 21051]